MCIAPSFRGSYSAGVFCSILTALSITTDLLSTFDRTDAPHPLVPPFHFVPDLSAAKYLNRNTSQTVTSCKRTACIAPSFKGLCSTSAFNSILTVHYLSQQIPFDHTDAPYPFSPPFCFAPDLSAAKCSNRNVSQTTTSCKLQHLANRNVSQTVTSRKRTACIAPSFRGLYSAGVLHSILT